MSEYDIMGKRVIDRLGKTRGYAHEALALRDLLVAISRRLACVN